jgi:NifU-like protein involved in Fe-S cluster formation
MSDYIDWGLRRRRRPALPVTGAVRHDPDGRHAMFSLALEEGRVADVTFDATACVTLVAYCELLCRQIQGLTPRAAVSAIRPLEVASALPRVPMDKRERALLASQALMATLITALQEERA